MLSFQWQTNAVPIDPISSGACLVWWENCPPRLEFELESILERRAEIL